jgi:hypothetical protein
VAKRKRTSASQYSLYVIDLDKDVLKNRRFMSENSHYDPTDNKPCVYVGHTAKTPDARYLQHKEGGQKSSSIVERFGLRLIPRDYESDNPLRGDRANAIKKERELAKKLKQLGYAVWQK